MKVLAVTNLYPPDVVGGYELGCEQMLRELGRRGHETRVLTTRPRRPVAEQPGVVRSLRLVDRSLRGGVLRSGDHGRRLDDLASRTVESANVAVLLDELAAFDPDVVYLWNVLAVGALGLAGALAHRQLPVVWHLMDAVPAAAVTVDGRPVSSVAGLLSRRLRAHYLACSQRVVDENARAGVVLDDHVTVVPNWIHAIPEPSRRARFPAGGEPLRIAFAGQLDPHKGVDVILGAAALLRDAGWSNFSIDLWGTGREEHYEGRLLELDLAGVVRLGGALPHAELLDRLGDYDVFLLPTWKREPFAFAPMEAAARGCVPLVSEDCGFGEWFVDGVHCFKVAPRPERYAAALASILDGRVALEPVARRARAAITGSFTVERVASEVERAMAAACARPAHRPGRAEETYHLARLAEHLLRDWAERI